VLLKGLCDSYAGVFARTAMTTTVAAPVLSYRVLPQTDGVVGTLDDSHDGPYVNYNSLGSANRSSWALRVLVGIAGWFSVLMTAASVQQYYYFKGDTADDRRMRSLQVPSLVAHPFFAVAALLLVHALRPGFRAAPPDSGLARGLTKETPAPSDMAARAPAPTLSALALFVFSWAFAGSAAVMVLYVRSLDPAVGMKFPGVLVDWGRSVLYTASTVAVAVWGRRARVGSV
jgi:hypothetical protein